MIYYAEKYVYFVPAAHYGFFFFFFRKHIKKKKYNTCHICAVDIYHYNVYNNIYTRISFGGISYNII